MAPNNNEMTEQANSMMRILLAELNKYKDESARKDKEIERLTSEVASLRAERDHDKTIRDAIQHALKRKVDDENASARNVRRRSQSDPFESDLAAMHTVNEAASELPIGELSMAEPLQHLTSALSSEVMSAMPITPSSLPADAWQCNVDGHLKAAGPLPAEVKTMVEAMIPDKFNTMTTKACMRCRDKAIRMVFHKNEGADVACLDCARNNSPCVRKVKGVGAVLFPLCATDRGDCDEQDVGFWVHTGDEEPASLAADNPEYPSGNSRKVGQKGGKRSGRRS